MIKFNRGLTPSVDFNKTSGKRKCQDTNWATTVPEESSVGAGQMPLKMMNEFMELTSYVGRPTVKS